MKYYDIVPLCLVHLIDIFPEFLYAAVKKYDTLSFLSRIDTCKVSRSVFHPAGIEIFICTLSLLVRVITVFHNLNDMLKY